MGWRSCVWKDVMISCNLLIGYSVAGISFTINFGCNHEKEIPHSATDPLLEICILLVLFSRRNTRHRPISNNREARHDLLNLLQIHIRQIDVLSVFEYPLFGPRASYRHNDERTSLLAVRLQPGQRQLSRRALLRYGEFLHGIYELAVRGEGVRLVARKTTQEVVCGQVVQALELAGQDPHSQSCVRNERGAILGARLHDVVPKRFRRPETGFRLDDVDRGNIGSALDRV